MDLPEASQELMGRLRQRNEAISVALGVTDVHASACRVDIPHLQPQSFTEAQAQTIEREEERPVTDHAGGGEYPLGLLDRDNIRQALGPGRLDQTRSYPGLTQDMRVVELQPIQIQFDRAPGMRCHKLGEVVRQLSLGQTVNLIIKALPDPADGAGVSFNRFGLQALELEMLKMRMILLIKVLGGILLHAGYPHEILQNHSLGIKG